MLVRPRQLLEGAGRHAPRHLGVLAGGVLHRGAGPTSWLVPGEQGSTGLPKLLELSAPSGTLNRHEEKKKKVKVSGGKARVCDAAEKSLRPAPDRHAQHHVYVKGIGVPAARAHSRTRSGKAETRACSMLSFQTARKCPSPPRCTAPRFSWAFHKYSASKLTMTAWQLGGPVPFFSNKAFFFF